MELNEKKLAKEVCKEIVITLNLKTLEKSIRWRIAIVKLLAIVASKLTGFKIVVEESGPPKDGEC